MDSQWSKWKKGGEKEEENDQSVYIIVGPCTLVFIEPDGNIPSDPFFFLHGIPGEKEETSYFLRKCGRVTGFNIECPSESPHNSGTSWTNKPRSDNIFTILLKLATANIITGYIHNITTDDINGGRHKKKLSSRDAYEAVYEKGPAFVSFNVYMAHFMTSCTCI